MPPVTLRDLLAHCSGLPAHKPFYCTMSGRPEIEKAICATPLECEPRSRSVYSDLGFMLLGFVLEDINPLDVQFEAVRVQMQNPAALQCHPDPERDGYVVLLTNRVHPDASNRDAIQEVQRSVYDAVNASLKARQLRVLRARDDEPCCLLLQNATSQNSATNAQPHNQTVLILCERHDDAGRQRPCR